MTPSPTMLPLIVLCLAAGYGSHLGHADVHGNERADRLASTATIVDGRSMDRADVINNLRDIGRAADFDDSESTSLIRLRELGVHIVTTGLPSHNDGTKFFRLHKEDYMFIDSLPRSRAGADMPGFHYMFVDTNGQASYNRGPFGTQIEIAGSPRSSDAALRAAADIIAKMTRYMPENIFTQLASDASVGIFTAAEKILVFPEFAHLANGNCGTSCSGACAYSCTFDGRKWEDIAGIGAKRGITLDDNLLCTPQDPYRHTQNILSHEFTHTIHNALPGAVQQQILTAYQTAWNRGTWVMNSYAMGNEHEYLAEGASVYFFVNNDNWNTGGMNNCNGRLCSSEWESRENLRQKDPLLYNILTYVFTDNQPRLLSGLTVCPAPGVIG